MVYFEHTFKDGTGIRIVDVPDEDLNLEIPTIQFRISPDGQKVRILKAILYDSDTKEFLFDEMLDGLLQKRLKEEGKRCMKCGKYFLPHSPSQKQCVDCREAE
ncbi:MAG: hypothetical protein ACTSWQ_02775 [Candidatus Thorarchaeota archaeon]